MRDIRRELETAEQAIEALDADLGAGRLGPEEHARQRAEREREAGRLLVDLRRAQRAARERHPEAPPAPATAAPARSVLRGPLVIIPAACLLVVLGVGGGVLVGRWLTPPPAPVGSSGGDAVPAPAMKAVELQALRQVAAREDAPIPSLLQFAHVALDDNRLDEARNVYQRVLARDPRNVEAITHLGAVAYQEGKVDEALAKVEEALRLDPTYVHAHWDRTQYLFHGKRDYPGAIRAAEAFLRVVPDGPDADSVKKLMAEARQQAGTPATR